MLEGDEIEKEAAAVLGYMLLEFTRLDVELGLLLVWSNDGKEVSLLTKRINGASFSKRLELLEKLVYIKYSGTPTADLYGSWLSDAHAVRSLRNRLFHGRWGFMSHKQLVANVVGLPTSPDQAQTCYSISQLQDLLQTMRQLRTRLSELRKSCPV